METRTQTKKQLRGKQGTVINLRAEGNEVTAMLEKENDKSITESQEPDNAYTELLSIRCNAVLYSALQKWLSNAHIAGDFTYTSVADVIRQALESHRQGMLLTELDESGKYKLTTIRVTKTQGQFYKKLPSQMKRQILDRAIKTYLKQEGITLPIDKEKDGK